MRPDGPEPTISRAFSDGTLVELVYQPEHKRTALAVRRADGAIAIVPECVAPSGERLAPYSASNNLIVTECVLLPSNVTTFVGKADLLADVRAFLHRYVDLPPTFEAIAAHYVLLSWVYDRYNELPYLRFQGDFGTGKTRALIAIGSLCYKPFFASGASTVSPIFHVLEAFRGSLILDEADFRFSDATASLTKILNNGNVQGMPVLRTMSNPQRELNPKAYRVFGPKVIGMRGRFADPALESRFVTHETGGSTLRPDVPIQLPIALRAEARELRNKLLTWRLRQHADLGPDHQAAPIGLSPRAAQMALPLLSLMDDDDLRIAFVESMAGQDRDLRSAHGSSLETHLLAATLESFDVASGAAPVADIASRLNVHAASTTGRAVTHRAVGGLLRSRLGVRTVKRHGVYVVPWDEQARLIELAGKAVGSGSAGDIPERVTHSE